MRQFYHLRFEVGKFRDVESLGPFWLENEFYGEDIPVDPTDGPLDMSRAILRFDPAQDWPIADFNNVMMLPSCSRKLYDDLFAELLADHIVRFDTHIGEDPHVLFRPIKFFDLVDLERSRYLYRATRGPYAFKEIALWAVPPETVPIFAIEPPQALRYETIVDDRFADLVRDNDLTGLILNEVLSPLA